MVHSACALADAERLAAWRATAVADARAALARAESSLDVHESDDIILMPMDRALLDLSRASVLVDIGCVERDSSRFTEASRIVDALSSRIDDQRAPRIALQAQMLRYRLTAQRAAISPAPVFAVRLRSIADQMQPLGERAGDSRLAYVVIAAKQHAYEDPPEPYVLTYPQLVPF